ncbi:MAG: CpaF family protein [Candidatus Micrarchaeota archaeon]|nr:CpaF family protein [Candidatus Micrarchaeota archaeon]MDE1804219.1 CpaF family protein [Candidatus Micrarchaeota archaeon]MDE1846675.1 CpaF family protein [Candidatus Micrarchaeota archaeon]
MNDNEFYNFESAVFDALAEKLSRLTEEEEQIDAIKSAAKSVNLAATEEEIDRVVSDSRTFAPLDKYMEDPNVEDIMVNNLTNIFIYTNTGGQQKVAEKIVTRKEMALLVKKFKMYITNTTANSKIFDVHLPNGSRVNIVDSPLGADITIRNFKPRALSIIDLINAGELNYSIAARLWLYMDGFKVRPANFLIGGMPGSGKTTLFNALFSFFRPEERVILIEETYELNTETQENAVRLETSVDVTMEDLVKNALRMRPDIIMIGEVRGAEAKDMMTAMNIGKISMGTIHASNARDVVTRLQHSPMNIEKDIIPLIDAIIVVSQVQEAGRGVRKITQISEISGIETQVLLSDLYLYDYKTRRSSPILPSVTYRDLLSRLTGYPPSEIMIEEQRRAKILEKLNQMGIRDLQGINKFCKEYYHDPVKALERIGLKELGTLPWY